MKKLLVLVLALMMALSLAACGGDKDPASSGSGTTDPGTSQQEQANTPSGGNTGDEKDYVQQLKENYEYYGIDFSLPDGWTFVEYKTSGEYYFKTDAADFTAAYNEFAEYVFNLSAERGNVKSGGDAITEMPEEGYWYFPASEEQKANGTLYVQITVLPDSSEDQTVALFFLSAPDAY